MLLAAPRRREESLSAMTALQTRAARRAGQSQLGPALCLRAQATVDHAVVSEALVDRRSRVEQLLLTIFGISSRKRSAANLERDGCAGRTRGSLALEQSKRLRSDPETCARAKTRPAEFATRTSSQSFSFARAHKEPQSHAADALQDAATARHHADDAPSRAAAAGHEGSPLPIRSSPGSLKHG